MGGRGGGAEGVVDAGERETERGRGRVYAKKMKRKWRRSCKKRADVMKFANGGGSEKQTAGSPVEYKPRQQVRNKLICRIGAGQDFSFLWN